MASVEVRLFDRQGRLVGPLQVEKRELTPDEWRTRLTPEQFRVLRSHGTERPFCGTLLDNKRSGVYVCAGCRLPLFESTAKFQSGTGWPSFFRAIAPENVAERTDRSHGMTRVEILCARCDGHLGHVFDDGPRPTGLRYCLNSEALEFVDQEALATLAEAEADEEPAAAPAAAPAADSPPVEPASANASPAATSAVAVLAGGCFWCTELAFEPFDGVLDVQSGYCGGAAETADYESVCTGRTGHAEVVRITYDPSRITFDQLLDIFFDAHDPTQLNRQGNDVGTQYRSAVFYLDERQRAAAAAKIEQLDAARKFARPIVTQLEPLVEFFPAEAYHQDYGRRHPDQPYIAFHAMARACQVRDLHARLVRRDS